MLADGLYEGVPFTIPGYAYGSQTHLLFAHIDPFYPFSCGLPTHNLLSERSERKCPGHRRPHGHRALAHTGTYQLEDWYYSHSLERRGGEGVDELLENC